ncbi:unnamed protein product, partial [Brenthis ino]
MNMVAERVSGCVGCGLVHAWWRRGTARDARACGACGGRVASGNCGLASCGGVQRDALGRDVLRVRVRVRVRVRGNTHYSNNDMHAVKLASKTRFSLICAQFHMNHDYFV